MKLIDGDKLERHLDYLIEKDNQFAKMCDGDSDFSRQRKYCFEVNALAYQLCKSVMDYYLVKDAQPAPQWISVKERLPEVGKSVLVAVVINAKSNLPFSIDFTPEIRIGWLEENGKWGLQFDSADRDEITHWMLLPGLPKGGDIE